METLTLDDTLELCQIVESENIRELLEEFIVLRGFNQNPVDSTHCKHGTYIGTWDGPDYLCQYCESGE